MRPLIRRALAVIAVVHGLIHLLGAGPAWWAAALLMIAAAVLLVRRVPGWWLGIAVAAVLSQALIVTAWSEAWAGTIVNVLLLFAAVYGYASQGPASFRREYCRRVAAVLAEPAPSGVVTEADLAHLPDAVAAYVRRSGAVGRPRIVSFRARTHGRIRQGPDRPWMAFAAEQVNTFGDHPARLFHMDATMVGLPVDVLHTFVSQEARMRAKVCSLIDVLDATGPEMTRAETVTLLNDLCIFAPAALVDAPLTWQPIADQRVLAIYTHGAHTVTAELVFNDHAELVDFISDDRPAATADGKGFMPQRWSTPLRDYAQIGTYRLATAGEGRWHPAGEEPYDYIELHLDDITYNLGTPGDVRVTHPAG